MISFSGYRTPLREVFARKSQPDCQQLMLVSGEVRPPACSLFLLWTSEVIAGGRKRYQVFRFEELLKIICGFKSIVTIFSCSGAG
mmetsp:Transcript_31421/g.72319  ORF Transcript_31421/g.72319 Transcript_31421/m.72319 type:complete len:85 (-) Transcript_31421:318-572(-)